MTDLIVPCVGLCAIVLVPAYLAVVWSETRRVGRLARAAINPPNPP